MPAGIKKVKATRNPFAAGGIGSVTFGTPTAESSNARTVSCQFYDGQGKAVATPTNVIGFVSGDAAGAGVQTGTAPASLLAGTNGKALAALVTGLVTLFQTKSDGTLDVVLTDAQVRSDYLCFQLADGTLAVSSAIAFA
jgi:hypothetical protein